MNIPQNSNLSVDYLIGSNDIYKNNFAITSKNFIHAGNVYTTNNDYQILSKFLKDNCAPEEATKDCITKVISGDNYFCC